MKIYVVRFTNKAGYREWHYVMANTVYEADKTFRAFDPEATNITIEERNYHSAVIVGHSKFYNDNYERVQ